MRLTFDAGGDLRERRAEHLWGPRAVLVGRVTDLPAPATDYLIGAIQRAALWSRFDAVAVTLAPKRPARGLVVAGIHRFVMPVDWSASNASTLGNRAPH